MFKLMDRVDRQHILPDGDLSSEGREVWGKLQEPEVGFLSLDDSGSHF